MLVERECQFLGFWRTLVKERKGLEMEMWIYRVRVLGGFGGLRGLGSMMASLDGLGILWLLGSVGANQIGPEVC
jgi:hypothetical protein